ncbi:MAG: AAA family ATPase, partial [Lachnospiraceae bacterium]|nr:AAA family ATPase [Lachnospiraceae bacterium]
YIFRIIDERIMRITEKRNTSKNEAEMKKIYLVGGTMGVGKTAVCQKLKKELADCGFLEGDWCWDADPFPVNEASKGLAQSLGFQMIGSEEKTDRRNGQPYVIQKYI